MSAVLPAATVLGTVGSADEISKAKFKALQCESALRKAREAVVSCEVDLKVAQARISALLAPLPPLSPFAERMLAALRRLTKERVAHPCGGFTSDDMEWQMGIAFTPEETLHETLEALEAARLIRHAGYDDNDAIGTCYDLTEAAK